MGILLNHPDILPTAHFLQGGERNSGLYQPTCPSMPQIVPSEINNAYF